MNKLTFVLLMTLTSISSNLTSQDMELDSLDEFIQKLMSDFDVPGLSLGILKDDKVLYLKGHGTREISRNLPVNEHTIFGIGSISKSFTVLTLGILVGQGKLDWDDRVRKYLPYFELYDSYVTEHFTIRDLIIHRSGLKWVSGGTLWYHSDLSRTEIVKRLKYLKPVSDFRDKPNYQNVMYVAAAEIVEVVSGMTWDQFLQTQVFDRIEMVNSTSISDTREQNINLAEPHIWDSELNKISVEQERGDNLAPGGFIYSSAYDMTNYMRMLLNDGVFRGDTIVKREIIDEIFKPQIHFSLYGPPWHNEFTSYGLGWWLTPKGNQKVIEHSGGIDGMAANITLIKKSNYGLIVLTNTDELAPMLLTDKVLDKIYDGKSNDVYDRIKAFRDNTLKQKKEEEASLQNTRTDKTTLSLPLKHYVGKYADKMYGAIDIQLLSEGNLEISFSHTPLFTGKLNHWHFDTFRIDWYDERVPDGFLTFNFNSKREILGFSLDQKNLLDVDFTELEIVKVKGEAKD